MESDGRRRAASAPSARQAALRDDFPTVRLRWLGATKTRPESTLSVGGTEIHSERGSSGLQKDAPAQTEG